MLNSPLEYCAVRVLQESRAIVGGRRGRVNLLSLDEVLGPFGLRKAYWVFVGDVCSELKRKELHAPQILIPAGRKPGGIGYFVRRRSLSALLYTLRTSDEEDSFQSLGVSKGSTSDSFLDQVLLLMLMGALLGVYRTIKLSEMVSCSSILELIFIPAFASNINFKIQFTIKSNSTQQHRSLRILTLH